MTIQIKALCLYLHMVLFVFQNFTKFGRNLVSAKFGSERVKGAVCVLSGGDGGDL